MELSHRERQGTSERMPTHFSQMKGAVSETDVGNFSSEVILLGARFFPRFLKSIVSDHNEEEFQWMRDRECECVYGQ
jgi:hypothetical protein